MPRQNSQNSKQSSSSKTKKSQDKYEIAEELGVNIGKDATASENGKVGGEMRKRQTSSKKNSSR